MKDAEVPHALLPLIVHAGHWSPQSTNDVHVAMWRRDRAEFSGREATRKPEGDSDDDEFTASCKLRKAFPSEGLKFASQSL